MNELVSEEAVLTFSTDEELEKAPKVLGRLWGLADKDFIEDGYGIFTSRPLFERDGVEDRIFLLTDKGPYRELPCWKEDLDEFGYEEIEYGKDTVFPTVQEDDQVVVIGPRLWDSLFKLLRGKVVNDQPSIMNISWLELPNGFYITCMNKSKTSQLIKGVERKIARKIRQLSEGFFVRGKLLQELFAVYQVFNGYRK